MTVIKNPFEQKVYSNWWNQPQQSLHYAAYQVNKTQVYIGVRPDARGTTPEFYQQISAWINVSDRFVKHPPKSLNVFIPWNEGGQPQWETIFAFLKTLSYWIDELELPEIYIACDGGTHRAVTLFGFYLLAYHPSQAKNINKNYTLVGRKNWSNPLEYAQTYIQENKIPGLELGLKKFKESTLGESNYGVSLDDFLKTIITKKVLYNYYLQRFFDHDLKTALYQLKNSLVFLVKYQIGHWLITKPSIFLHKLFNTTKGQWYKKHNF